MYKEIGGDENMNIMDILVLIIILVAAFLGYKKGLVKTAVHFVSFFVAIGVALMFYRPLAATLTENTAIDEWVVEHLSNIGAGVQLPEATSGDTVENTNTDVETSEENPLFAVFSNLPTALLEQFQLEEMKEAAQEELVQGITELIMNLLSLILIYVVVKVGLWLASFVLDGIMHIPVLKQLNEVLGLVFGALQGILQVYVIFACLTFIASIADISFLIDPIKVSAFASVLYENNLILHLLF